MLEQIRSEMYKHIESQIKDIAMNRRLVEVDGGDVDEFDRKMNEWCDKYHDYFKDMSLTDILAYMLAEVTDAMLKEAKDGRR
jgi:predicted nucleic acid-binding protein